MKKYIAEGIGTMVLVVLGCGTAMLVGCDAAYGGGYETITDASKDGGGIRFDKVPTNMQLSVKLLFDRTEDASAFPVSTMRSNVANSVGNVISSAKSLISGPAVSVETVVEGFIGAVRGAKTKEVCFEWGKMSYEGICKGVSATYTLFDAIGQPTRAVVDFSIYLYDSDVQKLGDSYEMGYWRAAYKDVFTSNSSFKSTGQKLVQGAKGLIGTV